MTFEIDHNLKPPFCWVTERNQIFVRIKVDGKSCKDKCRIATDSLTNNITGGRREGGRDGQWNDDRSNDVQTVETS